jgi:hypothetical protein
MRSAIADAGLAPDRIDYVNAHGTGTPENDKMETLGMRAVFGDAPPPISSNKSMIGHTLSAAGAIEAVFSLLTIATGRLAAHDQPRDAGPRDSLDVVPNEARAQKVERVLSNSFGFGGQNVCLVLGAALRGLTGMRALRLFGDRTRGWCRRGAAAAAGPGEIQLRMLAVALNHIDVGAGAAWPSPNAALPMTIGAEAVGEVVAVGPRRGGVARRAACGALRRAHLRAVAALAARGGTTSARTCPACSASTWTASRRSGGTCRRGWRCRCRRAWRRTTQLAPPSPSPPSSTCCSTTRGWSRARPS